MNLRTLIARGLRFYWRTHLGVAAGCALSAAVLVGALGVGDSVRGSLDRVARTRLGRIETALETGSRAFRDDLGRRVGGAVALRVRGMAIRDGAPQVNRVEVLGVDRSFLGYAESPAGIELGPGDAAINEKLAAALGVKAGDDISLRMLRPSPLSRDAPLTSRADRETRRRAFAVRAVLSDAQLGRFSLKSDQSAPYNAFVDLKALQEWLEMEGRANLLVAAGSASLSRDWRIEDAGLELRAAHGVVQLQTPRIYLDPAVGEKALRLRPGAVGVLNYLVNAIEAANGRSTPYSFMTAASPGPPGMKDDEILINRWVADHLQAGRGDRLTVRYSELVGVDSFVERERSFIVRDVLEMESLARERELVPEFPGLTDVESCKDWKIGLPMDEAKLKDAANEAYWKAYRKTPKAFVTLAAGREMWANRFGDLMAVRYSAAVTPEELRARLDPADAGLVLRSVRQEALRAVSESTDLGRLFLGMSAFLIAASLALTALLFVFSVEQRGREMGMLLAVGWTPGRVRALFLGEGGALAVLGSALGIPLGWLLARFLIGGLGAAWAGAVAHAPVEFHLEARSLLIGAGAAAAVSLLAMALALAVQGRRTARELVAEEGSARPARWSAVLFALAALGAAGLVAGALASGERPVAAFFGAGALVLVAGVALVRVILARLSSGASLTVGALGVRNAARRPGRGMATAAILACGCFIVFSVAAMKEDLSRGAGERRSGTGGFELYGEASLALHHDLNDEKARKELRLTDASALAGVSFLQLKMREGDDASCLNLNQALAPPLLGVEPGRLSALEAFAGRELWSLLDREYGEAVPAIVGDSATAVWKLKKRIGPEDGDLLEYKDERGRPFKVKLVGAIPGRLSVLQGRLVVAMRHFTRLYPSESGYRVFLADVPPGGEARLAAHLGEKLEAAGIDWVPAVERLKEFYVVESTYLAMFFVLGGMGLLLGSAGMGVLVLRTVMERRGELALLRAVGYSREEAGRVVMAEHRFLLAAGIGTGAAAAALAVIPAAAQPGVEIPLGLLAALFAGTALLSLAWIRLAAGWALRSSLLPALRNE